MPNWRGHCRFREWMGNPPRKPAKSLSVARANRDHHLLWIGEKPTQNNALNHKAARYQLGGKLWGYGHAGAEGERNAHYIRPAVFEPRQNPFYVAFRNDKTMKGAKAGGGTGHSLVR